MKILAIDQARDGAWSVFDYEERKLVSCGEFFFPANEYSFESAVFYITKTVAALIDDYKVSAVFIEDIQYQNNIKSYKKLAQLQGALISLFEGNNYLYDFIPPVRWQNACNARGRNSKEKTKNVAKPLPKKRADLKQLSIQFVKENYGVETMNDNLADAICIGHFIVNNVKITTKE